jgi:ubiquitin-conjugating enzyme E2 T
MAGVTLLRLKKEMEMIEKDPPPGCSAWAAGDSVHELEAVIQGADDTPYAKGCFRLRITVPQRYPFEPPKVHFVTPIYHPNIDSAGRICLDILNMPDGNGKGAWKPSLNLKTVLLSIRLLMSEPNPDDGLMVDITHEYIHNRALFERTAVERTRLHATEEAAAAAAADAEPEASEPPAAATAASGGAAASSSHDGAAAPPAEAEDDARKKPRLE